eukprot:scaffold150983_cov26-Cyclotella_meneghiniana.AAC.1
MTSIRSVARPITIPQQCTIVIIVVIFKFCAGVWLMNSLMLSLYSVLLCRGGWWIVEWGGPSMFLRGATGILYIDESYPVPPQNRSGKVGGAGDKTDEETSCGRGIR